jgi:hypothetical protein
MTLSYRIELSKTPPFEGAEDMVRRALFSALNTVSDKMKKAVRAHIRGAGFSQKWANAFRVNVYPRKPALGGAIFARFAKNPGYFELAQTGGTVHAKKGLLWLPINKQQPPLRALKNQLKLVKLHGTRVPLMAAAVGTRQDGKSVPLFHGVASVTWKQRLFIPQFIEAARDELPGAYEAAMEKETKSNG